MPGAVDRGRFKFERRRGLIERGFPRSVTFARVRAGRIDGLHFREYRPRAVSGIIKTAHGDLGSATSGRHRIVNLMVLDARSDKRVGIWGRAGLE